MVCDRQRKSEPRLLPLSGMIHGNLGKYERAENDFSAALATSPDLWFSAEVLTSRSVVRLLQGGRDDEAEADLRAAITLLPKAYQGYVNLATLLERRGDLNRAVEQPRPGLSELHKQFRSLLPAARLHARIASGGKS